MRSARLAIATAAILTAQLAATPIRALPASVSSDVGFGKSLLLGEGSDVPTTLQFGPDGRLYVGEIDGAIKAYTIERLDRNRYQVAATETVTQIADIANHDDDGTLRPDVTGRLVTGLLVAGTAARPVLYASSSDPRFGGGAQGDTGLDTNSGIITRLRWDGTTWRRRNLVRGLPRSEEVHATNGLALDTSTHTLYVAQGGNTNMGAPSDSFGGLPEYALSAAILAVDLQALGRGSYDLPTLDDPTRRGDPDAHDPFGGNDGLNQARVVPGGPVQVYSPGYRNPYDLVIARNGNLYGTDNGANAGVGGPPVGEGAPGCGNDPVEGGISGADSLHLIEAGDYGGHPDPTRADRANTFGGQSPVPSDDPRQCDWLVPGPARGSLATFPESTDGVAQYTASNFAGAMTGDLLLTTLGDNLVYRVEMNAAGDAVVAATSLFSNVGKKPLDVTTQGDGDLFPGTIWVADHLAGTIVVFEPNDYGGTPGPCTGLADPTLDDDADGFSNADEIDNGTDPCSAGDVPPDVDGDRVSDRNDPDDDNDGRPDTSDPFALDPTNGSARDLPVRLTWDPGSGQQGGLAGTGFTGLMTDGVDDYSTLFDASKVTVGNATGTLTVDAVPDGTAHLSADSQRYGFQMGLHVDPPRTPPFLLRTRIVDPFGGQTPLRGQSMGLTVGTGGQDDYAELSVTGAGTVEFRVESAGLTVVRRSAPVDVPGPDGVDLTLHVDPSKATVTARYAVETGGILGPTQKLGTQVVPAAWFAREAVAIGVISTSHGSGDTFPATWDYLRATALASTAAPIDPSHLGGGTSSTRGPASALGSWQTAAPTGLARAEVSFSRVGHRFYLAGGGTAHQMYNPRRDRWRSLAASPDDLDHIQSVTLHGRIYSIGGLRRVPGHPKPSVGTVSIYDPSTDTFSTGEPMPAGRERGAGGVAVWQGRIYYFGGLHDGVAKPWVDVYDPASDGWTSLPDMPRARDHFQAAVVDGRMYAIGGRQGDRLHPFGFNDAYDFATGSWTTGLAELPTARGGYASAVAQGHILIVGGEGDDLAYPTLEAYDPTSDTWTTLADMPTARHGIQAVVWHRRVFITDGGTQSGGTSPTDATEVYTPPAWQSGPWPSAR